MTDKILTVLVIFCLPLVTSAQVIERNDASAATGKANKVVAGELPFDNVDDFELAARGLISRPASTIIRNASGDVVWNMDQFAFLQGDSPDTVNPSLWRQAKLNTNHGLFKVSERIYQVRGFDASNLSIIVGDTGYIVVDPLVTQPVAAAAMELVYEHLPKKPVVAVIYSHSHADHFGGVKGVVTEQDVADGKVRIIAPVGFMESAVAENILAGNVMTRRVSYMFGALLPKDEKGGVGAGLGKAVSGGQVTLIPPTDIITHTDEELVIDGVRMVFMNTPFAEAPAEMMFYLPQMHAFYAAEEANGTLHNLYTLRGAQVRDALLWSAYLHEAIDWIPAETEVLFGGHHWPRWEYDRIVEYLAKQGDVYKYIHDQTLRLANQGFTMNEISEQLELPTELAHVWYNRGYYGTVSHNARAVYQKYLGFFDGNPAHIEPLPPADVGPKYVAFMGGAEELLKNARKAYDNAEYRWVAEVVNHLVFADPSNTEARRLQADALEQLGYQAESGQWRNFYLTGASELRNGVNTAATTRTMSQDMVNALSIGRIFDFLGVRLNGSAAAGKHLVINFVFEDSGDDYLVTVVNGVLRHSPGIQDADADATVTLSRKGFLAMTMAGVPISSLVDSNTIKVAGDAEALSGLVALLDKFEFWFNIVTP